LRPDRREHRAGHTVRLVRADRQVLGDAPAVPIDAEHLRPFAPVPHARPHHLADRRRQRLDEVSSLAARDAQRQWAQRRAHRVRGADLRR
jgi:hypothetical protein